AWASQSTSPCQPETSWPWRPAAWAAGAARAAVAVPRAAAPSAAPRMSERREGAAAAGGAGGGVRWRGRYGDMASPGGSRDAEFDGATVVTPCSPYGVDPAPGHPRPAFPACPGETDGSGSGRHILRDEGVQRAQDRRRGELGDVPVLHLLAQHQVDEDADQELCEILRSQQRPGAGGLQAQRQQRPDLVPEALALLRERRPHPLVPQRA